MAEDTKGPKSKVGKFLANVDWKTVAIVSLVIIGMAILIKKFFGGLRGLFGQKKSEKKGKKLSASEGGKIPAGWEPNGVTAELFEAIDGIMDSNASINRAFAKFNALNDNQVIEVYNYWDKVYKNETSGSIFSTARHGSLTHSLANENYKTDSQVQALETLRRLNLT